jgi:ABC-2 type transport system ATP-binding protein
MADIQELCQRVIIIDHGSIFFDGKLSEIIDRFADSKLITIQCEPGAAMDRAILDECGTVLEQNPTQIKLKVRRERVIPVCKRLLDVLPVTDIDIQEVPIEDIIRQLFARERS